MPENSLVQVILMDEKITKDMTLGDLLTKFPQTAEVLMQKGMHCVGCHVAVSETLEQGLKAHGMDDKGVDGVLKELNDIIK